MKDVWRETWAKRVASVDERGVLSALIHANGFDQGCGAYTPDQWISMAEAWSQSLSIQKGGSILEVGCGAGAFLYALQLTSEIQAFGYDYSPSLIQSAQKYLVGEFFASEAIVNPFSGQLFDAVISHSVFHYFPTVDYARAVVKEMAKSLRAGGKIALLDLNDATFENDYQSERMKGFRSVEEYEEKYRHHKHLFLRKEEVADWLDQDGITDVQFLPHPVEQYGNARFRFNVVGTKS